MRYRGYNNRGKKKEREKKKGINHEEKEWDGGDGVRRSSGVRSCLFCRLPWGKFRLNWPTHGISFSVFLLFSPSLPLWSAHAWVTDKKRSLLSIFVSPSLPEFLGFPLSTFFPLASDRLYRFVPYPCACLDCLTARFHSQTLRSLPLEAARLTARTTKVCWIGKTEYQRVYLGLWLW